MSASRDVEGLDLLSQVIAEIAERRDSLRAAVQEYEQLLTAIDAIGDEQATPTPSRGAAPRKAPAAVKAAPKAKAARKARTTKVKASLTPKVVARAASPPAVAVKQTPAPAPKPARAVKGRAAAKTAAPAKAAPAKPGGGAAFD